MQHASRRTCSPNSGRSVIAACARLLLLALWAASLAARGAAAPLYVALGASDARGYGASDYVSSSPPLPNSGYVCRIHESLRERYAPWRLLNLGGSGYTAGQVRETALPQAIAARPALVTLFAGANDVRAAVSTGESTESLRVRFEAAFRGIVRRLRDESSAFVVTASLPDMGRIPAAALLSPEQRQRASEHTRALNEVIGRVAAQYGAPVVNLYGDPAAYDPANYSWDGFHPNDAGYAMLAERFLSVLRNRAWRLMSGLGDVDGDGLVTGADAAWTLRHGAGLAAGDDRQRVAADTEPPGGDGLVGVEDAMHTLRRAAGQVPDGDWR